jgi:hemoglobin-like flavoprotein
MVEGMSSGAISAIAASISALAAVTALWVTNNISRKHHVESLKLSQYIAITQRVFDVDMLFVKNPDLRSYFYESIFSKLPRLLNIFWTSTQQYKSTSDFSRRRARRRGGVEIFHCRWISWGAISMSLL